MHTRILLAALATLASPGLAAAQTDAMSMAVSSHDAAARLASPVLAESANDAAPSDAELIEEDRVLSDQLVEASGHEPATVELSDELYALDVRLSGRQRPADTFGVGIGLIVPGVLGVGAGLVLIFAGIVGAAGHATGCVLDTLLGSSSCPRYDNSGYFIGGGISAGVGLLMLIAGVVLAVSGRRRAAFDRRDELREELRTWVNATVTPNGDGGTLVVGGSF